MVKPLIKPEAVEAPANIEQAVHQVATALGKQVDLLAKSQSDIAACYEADKASPPGRDESAYIVCLAEPPSTRSTITKLGASSRPRLATSSHKMRSNTDS